MLHWLEAVFEPYCCFGINICFIHCYTPSPHFGTRWAVHSRAGSRTLLCRSFASRIFPLTPFISRLSSGDWLPLEWGDWGRWFQEVSYWLSEKNDYVNKLWPKQTLLTPGEKNVVSPPFVLPEKIYLPPLHIKLGLMNNFVKGMDKINRGFEYEE